MREWQELRRSIQKARKEYRCESCPHPGPVETAVIPAGQLYRKLVGLEDHRIFVFRECFGVCPHATKCTACNGVGLPPQGAGYEVCLTCDGTGKVRR